MGNQNCGGRELWYTESFRELWCTENCDKKRIVINRNLWYTEIYGIHQKLLYVDNPGVQSRKVYREFWDKKCQIG